ncbi:uncharacterized protein LOC129229336 [Uloborus diversus]|uniref:uncharacterized protein LOC129229336 n=1 Tax=Uloborus diversus TaxID=327109 RepID=UPI002409878D|nr:uncharacterized protein LOC129229336 [Uloborus diversus]
MFCMKNDWWQYVAKCFLRWVQGPKKILLRSLLRALTAQYMHSEDLLFKFAVAVHGSSGQLSLLHLNVYGQILITFMLEAYEQQKFDIAFNILFILHQQSINYNDLQLSVASYYTDEKSYMKNSTTGDHFLLPQTVSLTAVDTCLQVKRPKDAYEIFKANSWIQVKDVEIPHLQSELFKKKFKCLMKLVRALVNVHPVKGFDAFLVLFKNINSDNFELLNPYKGELDDLFNEYLTNMLNTDEEDKALHLYEYGSEHCKGMLNVDCDILRGFLIKLAQKKKMEKAKNFFHLGQIKKVYSIEKPQQPPWTLTIPSFWTRYEIKFAIEFYFQNLFPLLREKPKQTVFEEWFQVQIVIKEQSDKDSEVNCLREVPNRMVSAMELTSVALKMLDPNLKVEEITSRNMLLIHPKTFYNFWSLKYGAISPRKVEAETFHIQGQKGISFGKEMTPRSSTDSSSSEKFRRLSSPLISPSFSENVLHRGEFTKTIECSPRKEEILHKSAFVKITPPQQSLSKLKPVQNTSHVESQNTIFSPNNVLQVPKKDKLNSAANHIEHTAFNSEFVHRAENTNSTCERCEQLAKCSPVKQTSDCQSSNNNFSDRVFSSCLSNDSSASTSLPKPKRKIVRHNTGIKFINSRPNSPTRLKRIAPSPVMKRAKESLDKAKLFKVPAARTSNNKFENYTISVTGSASRSVIANKEKSVPSCVEPKKAQIQISPLWHKPIQRITALAVNHIECEENSNSSASPPLRTEENKDYSRIKNFLKIKFLQRQGSVPLRPEDLDQRIHLLSLKFMSSFDIEGKLDRTTMKMLTKFAEENI